ncbi:hypothetical protein E2C01_066148 [Portunus trituberculatus]|uniref:C2H2-type domain-containing protein n=1 Tax=Portunus trituberculatus TaxID=210409 RepID=A0A5B7HT32_PORTR|nr:hypothetical protein [Portunus trituberculatus]
MNRGEGSDGTSSTNYRYHRQQNYRHPWIHFPPLALFGEEKYHVGINLRAESTAGYSDNALFGSDSGRERCIVCGEAMAEPAVLCLHYNVHERERERERGGEGGISLAYIHVEHISSSFTGNPTPLHRWNTSFIDKAVYF